MIMPATLDAISHDALVLPPDQRVTLAYRLLASVEPDPEPGADAAWETEITQRIARFDSGESPTVPASEVFARLREIAPGQ
jgi:putative addiction module component (TIGR02574 family)